MPAHATKDSSSLAYARAVFRRIDLYDPPRTSCRIDLSDNTNLFGAPPSALAVIAGAPQERLARYPSLYTPDLKAAIGAYCGVAPECVVTGCGSDDVLDASIRAFCEPGSTLATPEPSFPMVPLFALMNGLAVQRIPLLPDRDVDTEALLAARASVTYVCSPNNPTGNVVAISELARIAHDAAGIVLMDEAYFEFAGQTFVHDAVAARNVLVVRTLSKAFGLAGLRIGFAIGHPDLIREVEKSRGPFKVSSLAEEAATAALTLDRAWVLERAAQACVIRDRLISELVRIGLSPLPSRANFVLVPVGNAAEIAGRMRDRGVLVRAFPALTGIGDALRISVGPWPVVQEALAVLRESIS